MQVSKGSFLIDAFEKQQKNLRNEFFLGGLYVFYLFDLCIVQEN